MSITTKAAAAFLTFALACVVVTAVALISGSQEELEEAVSQRQLLLTRNRATALRDHLDLAGSELAKLGHELDQLGLESESMQPSVLHAWERSAFFNRSLQIVDASGRCLLIQPEGVACPEPAEGRGAWGRRALSTDATVITYVSEPDGTGQATLAVRVGGAGATWILAGTVDLEDDRMLGPALHDDLPESTRVVLASRDGKLLYRSHRAPAHGYLSQARDHLGRTEAGAEFVEEGEARSLVAWAPVGFGDLDLVLAWPWNELRSSTDIPMRRLLFLAGLATALALAGGYVMSQLTVRPLLGLVSHIREAQHDPTWLPAPTHRRDEIGTLERAFRDLLETVASRDRRIRADMRRIEELAATLEQRVADRTGELEAAQAALVDAERLAAIGQAAALISHELRNSLNSISVGADVLSRDVTSRDLFPVRQQVHAEISRLRSLSDDLLTFARPVELRIRDTDAAAMVRRTVELATEHAARGGVALHVNADGMPVAAALDGGRVQSALLNLLRNAIDAAATATATAAGAVQRVDLTAGTTGSALVFDVTDSGAGVDPTVVPRLYQPFVTTKRSGTGLGLATAKRFVAAHGGTLDYLGTGPNGGAWFRLTLPIRPANWAGRAATDTESPREAIRPSC